MLNRATAPRAASRAVVVSLAAAGLLAAACGPAALQTGTSFRTLAIGGSQRRLLTLTDVDTVRDLALTSDRVWAATDRGVLVYPREGDPEPRRITRAEGLPSDDVRALAARSDGSVIVATAAGLAELAGDSINPAFPPAPIGSVVDLATRPDGSIIACGRAGLARLKDGAWTGFGEPMQCTTLAVDGNALWVGTTEGALRIEGDDVVREHSQARGIPEPYVQAIAPLAGGKALALLRGPSRSLLGYWDGRHWYGYTVADFPPSIVGLMAQGDSVLLLTGSRAFSITPGGGRGESVPLVAVRADSEHQGVRTYRARVTPATGIVVPEGPGIVARAPAPLQEVEAGAPTLDAPPFSIAPATSLAIPEGVYAGLSEAGTLVFADQNRGLVLIPPEGTARVLRTFDLVARTDFQTASDSQLRTWALSRRGDLVRLDDDGAFHRVALPEGVTPQALATGEGGAYLCVRVGDTATFRIYRADGGSWRQVLERTLSGVTQHIVGLPFMGVAPDGAFWLGIEIDREDGPGTGTRMRGAVMLARDSETIVYHHRGAGPADGNGATPLPDEVTAVDFTNDGAWFPTLSGAVRVGSSQAVVFGEARGVRGEVVSDLATAPGNRVWVAAAEGIGVYENGAFNFVFPAVVQSARPTAVAVDMQGSLWAAGPRGAVFFDGTTWQRLTEENGLPTNDLRDVDVDAHDRAFFLTEDAVLMFVKADAPAPR
jgi:hypothetical protein